MIPALMFFLLVVSAITSLAAALMHAGLRRMGRASRGAWFASMALPPALLAAGAITSVVAPDTPGGAAGVLPGVPVLELPGLAAGAALSGAAGWGAYSVVAATAWLASAVALGLFLLHAHLRLARERGRWVPTAVLGREVLVSDERGPAVAGLTHP